MYNLIDYLIIFLLTVFSGIIFISYDFALSFIKTYPNFSNVLTGILWFIVSLSFIIGLWFVYLRSMKKKHKKRSYLQLFFNEKQLGRIIPLIKKVITFPWVMIFILFLFFIILLPMFAANVEIQNISPIIWTIQIAFVAIIFCCLKFVVYIGEKLINKMKDYTES